jgi:hypothetical protein
MKTILKPTLLGALLVLTLGGDFAPEAPLTFRFIPEAEAFIGRPATPMSVAGVARRTAYRHVAVAETAVVASAASASAAAAASASAAKAAAPPPPAPAAAAPSPASAPAAGGAVPVGTIVSTLPAGCVQTAVNNVEYQKCGPTYFRASFQGPNLIYVAQQP